MSRGFYRQGEYLFLSVIRQLSLVLDPGQPVISGNKVVNTKPVFVDFHAGPFGGEFRTKDVKLAEAVRNHNAFGNKRKGCVEIKSDVELAEWAKFTEAERTKLDDRVVRKELARANEPEPVAPVEKPQVPVVAAVGPGRPRKEKVAQV